jgi:hypothetical protein
MFNLDSSARLTVRNLQFKLGPKKLNTGNGNFSVDKCIVESGASTEETALVSSSMINSLVYVKNSASRISTNTQLQNATIINCTFIGSGAAHAFTLSNYSTTDNILQNCAFFGFITGVVDDTTKISAANSTYNATDLSTFGWAGTGNLVNKTFANQFQNIGSGTEDFRVKAGADVINAGIRAQTYTNDLDIVGSARSTAAPPNGPTIGAWESASTPVTSTDYSEPLSRGIFRGIERGVA